MRDGRQIEFHGHATVLDALEEGGVTLESDCRSGACGDCRLQLIAGTVRHLIVPEFTVPAGQILACCWFTDQQCALGADERLLTLAAPPGARRFEAPVGNAAC